MSELNVHQDIGAVITGLRDDDPINPAYPQFTGLTREQYLDLVQRDPNLWEYGSDAYHEMNSDATS